MRLDGRNLQELRSIRPGGKHLYLLSRLSWFTLFFIPTHELQNSGVTWTFAETYLRREAESFG